MGNNLTWKFESLELNILSKPFISLTRHNVYPNVVFNCKLYEGYASFIIVYSDIGRVSSSYNIVFFMSWGWLSYDWIFYCNIINAYYLNTDDKSQYFFKVLHHTVESACSNILLRYPTVES